MQDIHSFGSGGGTGGRLFGGNGGDRRLRPHHHHNNHSPQTLKCPRCESLNTKFCYYNNYNLSQPRYFCKSCRRYWTKGGVLRNVPVGGGCRKTKRSKPKSSSHKTEKKSSNSQNSSSESSSLTANTTTAAAVNTTTPVNTTTVTGVAPVTAAEVLSSGVKLNYHETGSGCSGYFNMPNTSVANPSFDPTLFPEIGSFTNLIATSTSQLSSQLPIGFNDISPFRLHNANVNQQQWMNTDHTEFSGLPDKNSDVGIGTDWNNNGTDEALFDLTGTVDDQSYWNQTQWDDHEHDHDNDNHQDHQLDYLP